MLTGQILAANRKCEQWLYLGVGLQIALNFFSVLFCIFQNKSILHLSAGKKIQNSIARTKVVVSVETWCKGEPEQEKEELCLLKTFSCRSGLPGSWQLLSKWGNKEPLSVVGERQSRKSREGMTLSLPTSDLSNVFTGFETYCLVGGQW